jgi:signal transduction histidine kinase
MGISGKRNIYYMSLLTIIFFLFPKTGFPGNNVAYLEDRLALMKFYVHVNLDSARFLSDYLAKEFDLTANDTLFSTYLLINGELLELGGKVDTAQLFYEKAAKLASENGDHSTKLMANFKKGTIRYNHGQFDKALPVFFAILREAKKTNNLELVVKSLIYIGKYHHSKGNFNNSLRYYKNALKISKRSNNKALIFDVQNNLGKHYETVGDYTNAFEHYLNNLGIIDSIYNVILKSSCYNHLGNLYQAIGDNENSVKYHKKALNARLKLGYEEGMAKSYNNLGEIYLAINKVDSALALFTASLSICKTIGYSKGKIKAYTNIGICLNKKQEQGAVHYFDSSMSLAKTIGYEKGIADNLMGLGSYYCKHDDYKKAIMYLKATNKMALELNLPEHYKNGNFYLSRVYEKTGDYKSSLAYYKQYVDVEKQLFNEAKNKQIKSNQLRYETEKKKRENEILKKENELIGLRIKRQKTRSIFISILLVISLLLIFVIYKRSQIKQKTSRQLASLNSTITAQNLSLKKLNNELNKVNLEKDKFFSIIAHELRNPLWWFRNLASTLSANFREMDEAKLEKSLRSINESAVAVFHLMDNLLFWSRKQLNRITCDPVNFNLNEIIQETIYLVKNEIEFKEIRLNNSIDKDTIVVADKDLIKVVFRNIISNSLKYTPKKGKISISQQTKKNCVTVMIEDTGIGIKQKELEKILQSKSYASNLGLMQEKGTGLGLMMCKEFIEMNNGKMKIESEESKGTRIMFSIPSSVCQPTGPRLEEVGMG